MNSKNATMAMAKRLPDRISGILQTEMSAELLIARNSLQRLLSGIERRHNRHNLQPGSEEPVKPLSLSFQKDYSPLSCDILANEQELYHTCKEILSAITKECQLKKELVLCNEHLQKSLIAAENEIRGLENALFDVSSKKKETGGEPRDKIAGSLRGKKILYVAGRWSILGSLKSLGEALGIDLHFITPYGKRLFVGSTSILDDCDAVLCFPEALQLHNFRDLKEQCRRASLPLLLVRAETVNDFHEALHGLALHLTKKRVAVLRLKES